MKSGSIDRIDRDVTITNPSLFPQNQDLSPLAQAILENLPTGVLLFNEKLIPLFANKTAAELIRTDQPLDETLGIVVESSTGPAQGWHDLLSRVLDQRDPALLEGVALRCGDQVRWLRLSATALTLDSMVGLLTIEDMGQLARVRQQLDHNERLIALGQLTSKVAHELNGPLDGILRYINLTTRAIDQACPEKSQAYLDRCREGLHRMVHIVGELLEHARQPRQSRDTASLESIVRQALHTVASKPQADQIQLNLAITEATPKVRIDNLYQILCNIIRNAYEAMPTGGTLSLTARQTPDGLLQIDCTDTGSGIPIEHLTTIFDPFYTTKEAGTGLGLAVSRDIVKRLGGTLTAQNNPEAGTTMTLQLPLSRVT